MHLLQDSTAETITTLDSYRNAYQSKESLSCQLYHKSLQVMPGGNTRHSTRISPYPVYVSHGKGSRVVDIDGEERIDFINNFTSLILGHADPKVTKAVQKRIELGTAFTLPTKVDIELAELLVGRVPYIDQIRFCNSGTEAVMLAIRAARAFTGRMKIAKFEGAFHGIYDYVLVSEDPSPCSWGNAEAPVSATESSISPSVAAEVVVLPWNNFKACKKLIEEEKDYLAAIVVDPLPFGIGMIEPLPDFIEFLRDITDRYDILLIADEVLSFRLSYYGAMHEFGIHPDLTALGKIIGGGFPVGAVAGKQEVMAVFDHTSDLLVHHSGTFNANPVTMTAGLQTLMQMTPDAFRKLSRLGDYARARITETLARRGIPVEVTGKASMFLVHLTNEKLVDFRSLKSVSQARFVNGDLCHEMLARGIITWPRGLFGCLSMPMTEAEVDVFVDAFDGSLTALGYRG